MLSSFWGSGGQTLERAVLSDAAEGGAQIRVPVDLAHARRAPLRGQERPLAWAPQLICTTRFSTVPFITESMSAHRSACLYCLLYQSGVETGRLHALQPSAVAAHLSSCPSDML